MQRALTETEEVCWRQERKRRADCPALGTLKLLAASSAQDLVAILKSACAAIGIAPGQLSVLRVINAPLGIDQATLGNASHAHP
jgi:hypothetical protein